MIAAIARKEFLDAWRDGRFRIAAAVILALLGVALLLAWQQVQRTRAEHAAAAALERENWLNQGEKNSHSAGHYGVYVFKPLAPLAIFDRGLEPFVGTTVFLEAHRQNQAAFLPAQDATAMRRFGELTAATGLQLLAPLMLALAVVLAYGLFWVALAIAVNAVARSAASAATSLGAAWVLLVLVAPTLLNVAVETLYPTPSRPELVAAGRQASGAAEKRGGELLNSFYRDHPELAPPGQQADFAAQHLTVQTEVGRAVEPVRQKFDEQLAQQQSAVGRWRFVSPAIAAHEALTDLAGTGYWRHRAFREQVNAFKKSVADFYTPKIHKRETLTLADYERMPRFVYQEESSNAWLGRAGAGLAGMLALSAVMAGLAVMSLRPARLGSVTT